MKEKQTPRNQEGEASTHEPKETAQRLEQKADEQEGESNRAAHRRQGARGTQRARGPLRRIACLASPQSTEASTAHRGVICLRRQSWEKNDAAEITDVRVHTGGGHCRARKFYEQKLGFKLKEEVAGGVIYEFGEGTSCFHVPDAECRHVEGQPGVLARRRPLRSRLLS